MQVDTSLSRSYSGLSLEIVTGASELLTQQVPLVAYTITFIVVSGKKSTVLNAGFPPTIKLVGVHIKRSFGDDGESEAEKEIGVTVEGQKEEPEVGATVSEGAAFTVIETCAVDEPSVISIVEGVDCPTAGVNVNTSGQAGPLSVTVPAPPIIKAVGVFS